MNGVYGKIKLKNFPKRLMERDYDTQLAEAAQKLQSEFGFSEKQLLHIVQKKPLVLLYEEEFEQHQRGLLALRQKFITEMGLSQTALN
jgi:hypothetical protein